MAQAKVGQNQSGGGHRFLSCSLASCATASWLQKRRVPRPVALIATEDGTPQLDDAQIGARWGDIFFQEFSGRGERFQQQDLQGRQHELRAPWRHQPCPEKWSDEEQTPATPWAGCGTAKPWDDCVPTEYLRAAGLRYLRALPTLPAEEVEPLDAADAAERRRRAQQGISRLAGSLCCPAQRPLPDDCSDASSTSDCGEALTGETVFSPGNGLVDLCSESATASSMKLLARGDVRRC